MNALKFSTVLLLPLFTQIGRADPLDTWTQRQSGITITNGLLQAIAYGDGLFVVVGEENYPPSCCFPVILTSADGENWVQRQLVASGIPTENVAVAYGNGLFVAVTVFGLADGSDILTSADGVNWVGRASFGIGDLLFGIAYVNGQFVAVGQGIKTSTNGTNWTQLQPGITNGLLRAITYGNGQFVAVGDHEGFSEGIVILTSSEAVNWVQEAARRIELNGIQLNGIAYGDGQFVAVGYNVSDNYRSAILTSTDGTNWVQRQSGATGSDSILQGIAYGNGQFVAVGSPSTIVTSPDGITWTSRTSGTGSDLYGIAYGNGHFVAGGGTILQSGPIINLSLTPNASTGLLSLSLEGPTGLDYTIQTSTDLISWRSLTNITTAQSANMIFEALPSASNHVFYRAYSH